MTAPAPEAPDPLSVWRRWQPRRLGARLAWGFGLLVVLMGGMLLLASAQMQAMTRMTERFATDDLSRLLRVQALTLQSEGAGNGLLRLMNLPRAERVPVYAEVDQRNRQIDGNVESLMQSLSDVGQEQTLQKLVNARSAYHAAYLGMVDEIEGDAPEAAQRLYTQQVQPALLAMQAHAAALLDRERERIQTQIAASRTRFERLTWGAGLMFLGGLVAAVLLAWGTSRSVVRPLAQVVAGAQRIAGGDYSQPVPATSAEEVDRVGQALNTMGAAIAEREREVQRLAFSDPLTGLPNRAALLREPGAAAPGPGWVMLVDLARLRTINDTLGFDTGDRIIAVVAARVQATLAEWPELPARLARLAGGNLGLWVPGGRLEQAEALVERLRVAMQAPAHCGPHSVDVHLALGLAAVGDEAPTLAQALRNAEVALASAKRQPGAWAWYSPAQEAARLSHLSLLSDLREAVLHDQLQMWLQPKTHLADGRVLGFEALVRWQHPERGFVSPVEFVPFAERTGAVVDVTAWMLARAFSTLARWAHEGRTAGIAVNLSTRDLQVPGLVQRVQQGLALHGVAPSRLTLEVTESGLMDDPDSAIAVLKALRETGVKLSIDDFGTGYSSLAYLQKLPVQELKIDRSFVIDLDRHPASQQLVQAMVGMGHGLGLQVTVEGVETEAERETLRQLGADVMQGYLVSKPLHGAALQDWLQRHVGPSGGGLTS